MIWNNSQEGYINNFLSNFPLEKFVPIFLIIFQQWYWLKISNSKGITQFRVDMRSQKNSKIGLKNWNKLCSWTSEGKKTYLEADFEVPNIEQASATI